MGTSKENQTWPHYLPSIEAVNHWKWANSIQKQKNMGLAMPVRLCFCTSVELRIGLEQDILSPNPVWLYNLPSNEEVRHWKWLKSIHNKKIYILRDNLAMSVYLFACPSIKIRIASFLKSASEKNKIWPDYLHFIEPVWHWKCAKSICKQKIWEDLAITVRLFVGSRIEL